MRGVVVIMFMKTVVENMGHKLKLRTKLRTLYLYCPFYKYSRQK